MAAKDSWSCRAFFANICLDELFLGYNKSRCVTCSSLRDGVSLIWKNVGLEKRDGMAQACDLLGRIDAGEASNS